MPDLGHLGSLPARHLMVPPKVSFTLQGRDRLGLLEGA